MKSTIEINEGNFSEQVLQSKLPVLLDFHAAWCGPCKMLAPVLEEIASEHTGRLVVGKVDVDQNPALAAKYGITAMPTLLYLAQGEVRAQTLGAAAKKTIVKNLASIGLAA